MMPHQKFQGSKVPREAPPPSRWGRSKTGTAFTWRKVGFRDSRGRKLYRLGYFMAPGSPPLWSSGMLWTLDGLTNAGVEWLDASPFDVEVITPTDQIEMPKDAVIDSDDGDDQLEATAAIVEDEVKAAAKPLPDETFRESVEAVLEEHKEVFGKLAFSERYGIKVGDVCAHASGKLYRVLEIVNQDTARVEQVLESGVKTPARNMSGTKLKKPR